MKNVALNFSSQVTWLTCLEYTSDLPEKYHRHCTVFLTITPPTFSKTWLREERTRSPFRTSDMVGD